MKLVPNLNFVGNCEEAFNFYAKALQVQVTELSRYASMPDDPNMTLTQEQKNLVMHVQLQKDGQIIAMGADILPFMAPNGMSIGNNLEICIMTDTKDEADRSFVELSKDGKIIMPMEDQFWGDYFWSCTDKYGVNWMIICVKK